MKYLIPGIFIIVGLINIYPLIGVLSTDTLTQLYGIPFEGSDLIILMRHRAVLFGLLGGFLLYAAFKPALQPLAITAGLISMLSFIALAFLIGDYGDAINKVILADIIASIGLFAVIILRAFQKEKS